MMLSRYCSNAVRFNNIFNILHSQKQRQNIDNDKNIIFLEQSPAEEKKQKEEKKRYLLRKLSFRPTVEELKEKKVRVNYYLFSILYI